MNSMNNIEYVSSLVENSYKVYKKEVISKYQVSFEIDKSEVHRLLSSLKLDGWKQLSYLSAIDWIEEDEFELIYIVMNWDKAVHVQIRTRISRENPSMDSILPIFPGCKYYERETHEFFGIKFPGNPDYAKQLILEGWDDIPPLRKDFDPRAYSDAHFSKREYSETFVNLDKKESKQVTRTERKERIKRIRKGGRK